ncbi:hypothetical protein T439DRAFT_320855 [Meredithblackwellia eburnea MCA 4105]
MGKKTVRQPSPPPIEWPSISRSSSSMSLVQVYSGLVYVDNLFSTQLCKSFISFFTSPQSLVTLQPSPFPPQRGEAARTNDRFSVQDQAFAQRLWEDSGLREICQRELESIVKGPKGKPSSRKPVGLNSNIRIYRYGEGAYFGPHYDDDFYDPVTKTRSEWTLLIYLSGEEDGVEGGETAFYPVELPGNSRGGTTTALKVGLKKGRALLHKHGMRDCMLHEGCEVKKGTKWVLRSDVMFQ